MNALSALLISVISMAGAATPKAANDNGQSPNKCVLLFMEESSLTLVEEHGQLVLDSGRRRAFELHQRDVLRMSRDGDRVGMRRAQELSRAASAELPVIALSSDGVIVEAYHHSNDAARLQVRSGQNLQQIRSVEFKASEWLGGISEVSRGGQYVIFATPGLDQIKVVSTVTGQILLTRTAQNPQEGVRVSFSGGNQFTVNDGGNLETYELSDDESRFLFSHRLGSDVGRVQYLGKQNSYLAFYPGAEPLILSLGKNSGFARRFFDPAKIEFTPTRDHVDSQSELSAEVHEIEKPSYSPFGLVSPSENLVFAVRTQGRGNNFLELIDVFSVRTLKLLRTISLPVPVQKLALSPGERFLAVSTNQDKGVRIYDLKRPGSKPYSVILFPNAEGSLVSFASENTILAGSGTFSEVYKFEFASPKN